MKQRWIFAGLLLALTSFSLAAGAGAGSDARLALAIKSGDRAAALVLLQQKADANSSEVDGTTALHWAVRADDMDMADRLIRAGASVKAANRYGVTPLYLASVNGSAPMIEKLLNAGADPNTTSNESETALMTAARTGNVEAAKVLLAHGAKIDARESWQDQTALMWAVSENHPEMVQFLIAHGADVNARSKLTNWERQNTEEPRAKWMPLGGYPPLLFASRDGCAACVSLLVAAGADINVQDSDGITPLISAIINGHYDAAGALIEKGANPNLADSSGRAPLLAAVDDHTMPASNRPPPREIENELSSLDVVKMLLARGANVNAQLTNSQLLRTKLDRGTDGGLGAGMTPLLRAAKGGDFVVMRLLLEKGADPKVSARAGNPLLLAAGVGASDTDIIGRVKTQNDVIESIKVCLEAGLDINTVDNTGRSALHGAAQQGFDEVVQFLADRGASLNIKDSRGITPLDVATGAADGRGGAGTPHESTAGLLRNLIAAHPSQ